MCYNSIGIVYVRQGNYSEAQSFCERAVQIAQQSLPANHRNLMQWKKDLEYVKTK